MASASLFNLSFLAAFSSCDIPGLGDVPALGRNGTERDGSMLASASAWDGFKIDEMAFGRWGMGFAVSSGSMVALRLRFRGDGALGCIFGTRVAGFEVTDALP